jgi:hypothetical protein
MVGNYLHVEKWSNFLHGRWEPVCRYTGRRSSHFFAAKPSEESQESYYALSNAFPTPDAFGFVTSAILVRESLPAKLAVQALCFQLCFEGCYRESPRPGFDWCTSLLQRLGQHLNDGRSHLLLNARVSQDFAKMWRSGGDTHVTLNKREHVRPRITNIHATTGWLVNPLPDFL